MILILNDEDRSTQFLIDYIKYLGHDYIALNQSEFYNKISIQDTKDNTDHIIINGIKAFKPSFIYNRFYKIDIKCFNDYSPKDIDYLATQWKAFFCYKFLNKPYAYNPETEFTITGLIHQFSFLFSLAKNFGFNVPKYYISSNNSELKSRKENFSEYTALT